MEINNSFLYHKRRLILSIFILMWVGAFVATHVPARCIPRAIAGLGDIVLHGVGFLGLSSWFILTGAAFGIKPLRRILLVLLVMMAYGAIDEYTQQFFGRCTELKDWLTDTTATIIAIILWETIFYLSHIITRTKISHNQ